MNIRKNILLDVYSGAPGVYELLDSGEGRKLEIIGGVRMVRSEPRAWWKRRLPATAWQEAVARFEDEKKKTWLLGKNTPKEFEVQAAGLKLKLKFLKSSKHIGMFPEQFGMWEWMRNMLAEWHGVTLPRVLTVFGYTGVGSLIAVRAGATVTHVDASEPALRWARENQELSGLSLLPIRWIADDAMSFLKREVKRGNRYDGIVLDPPSFGRGPKGEVWKAERDVPALLALCRSLLSDDPLFLILTMYATDLSCIALQNLVADALAGLPGTLEAGECALAEKDSGRLLPLSIFARWQGALDS